MRIAPLKLTFKRRVYGHPWMRWYRRLRTAQLSRLPRRTPYGFAFAGNPIYADEGWEPREREVIASFLPTVSVFIDVGANQGIHSCIAAQAGVHVVAVEPEEGNLRFLKENLRQFANAELLPLAVSDQPGILDFHGDGDAASLKADWVPTPAGFRQTVPVNTLDNLFADRWLGERLFIKVDVEGAEDAVLEGATRLLGRSPQPYWLIESFPGNARNRVTELLTAHGYAWRSVDDLKNNFLCEPLAPR